MSEIKEEQLYRLPEITKEGWLGIGYMSLYKLVRQGKIKVQNLSTGNERPRYAIAGEEIKEFIKRRTL